MTYPEKLYDGTPPHNGTKTSKEAAKSAKTETVRDQVLIAIEEAGGLTCDECEVRLNRPHTTISARIRELVLLGKIVDSGKERKTRWGRNARIYEVKT